MNSPATPSAASGAGSAQSTPTVTKSDFLAAEEIKGILQGREKAEQERIIRWVTESLGLMIMAPEASAHAATRPAPTPAQSFVHLGESSAPTPASAKNIKSFVGERKPKSDMQFAAVAAYFHRFESPDRKDTINAADLQEASRLARGYGFKKPLVTLNNSVRQGYFDRASRGQFRLNAVGENLVAMALPGTGGELPPNTTRRSGRNQARKRRKMQSKKTNVS
ncbi:MAG: hypothetical protein HY735_06770 [Verrucomicrobia bacterium]|nr:hypothetical protein [Verrucomicrobiota bacterium]